MREDLEFVIKEARRQESLGNYKAADTLDKLIERVAFFKNLQQMDDPRAKFFGGTNPTYTALENGYTPQYQMLSTPCGGIRIPMRQKDQDPQEFAESAAQSVQTQCPQLAQNEQAVQEWMQNLLEWSQTEYAGMDDAEKAKATPPQLNPPQADTGSAPQPGVPAPAQTPPPA
jgi:hypothetical protein